jgi:tetratricopeptide (TPR) repeat protein
MRARQPGWFGALMGDPRRRIRILLPALAAVIVLIVAAVILFRPPKVPPMLSRAQYRALIDRAVEQFQTDPAAAIAQLQELQQKPAEGDPKLAKILQDAFQADVAAVKNLEKGYEAAESRWEEVRKSAESTDAAINLAKERYDWFQSQVIDLVYLSAARDALKQGDYLKALSNASALNKAGKYGKDAETLIQQASDAVMKTITSDATQMHWTDATRHLDELIKARPDLADSLRPKVAEYEQDEAQRQAVEEAQGFIQQGQFAQAGAKLETVSSTGPYAQQAAALRTQIRESEVIRNAQKAYESGSGPEALEMLTKAGLGDSETARRIRAVIAAKTKATDAVQARRYSEAKAAWEEILRLEPAQANAYTQEAKTNLDNMPATIKAGAHRLVDEADLAFQDHKYQTARKDYEEALKLDPNSKEAKDGLARMSKSALFDFNIAIALPRDTLDQVSEVLQKLQSVRDRILTDDPLYLAVDRELTAVQRLKAKLEPQKPEQKGT